MLLNVCLFHHHFLRDTQITQLSRYSTLLVLISWISHPQILIHKMGIFRFFFFLGAFICGCHEGFDYSLTSQFV